MGVKLATDTQKILDLLKELFGDSESEPDVNDYIAAMIDDFGKRMWFLTSSYPISKQEEAPIVMLRHVKKTEAEVGPEDDGLGLEPPY